MARQASTVNIIRRLAATLRLCFEKCAPTCRQVTSLVSRSLDEKLSFRHRLVLGAHLLVCGACRLFRRQLRLLSTFLQRQSAALSSRQAVSLSPAARERIKRALRRESERLTDS